MATNTSELERYNRDFSFGGAAGGAAAGSSFGPIGTILGGIGGGLFGQSQQQQVAQPFDFPIKKVPDAGQSAFMTGMFGTQGNYNANALLPTSGGSAGFQFQNPYLNNQGMQSYFPQAQNFQQSQQQQMPQGFNGQQAFTQMFNDPNYTLNYGMQGGMGYPNSLQNAVNQGGQALQGYAYDQGATNQQMGGYNNIPFNNNLGLNKNINQAVGQGYQPFQDQLNLQSGGMANLGQGFQNIQNSQNAQGQLISQGTNLANQGQQQYQSGANNLQGIIGQNANQFQNYFQNQVTPTFDRASNYISGATGNIDRAAGFADYSANTINQANQFANQASGLAGGVTGDKDLARNILTSDISQRGGLINQGLNTNIDATTQDIANQIRNSTLNSSVSNITGGRVADQFNEQLAAGQANAAARGLGIGSSPVMANQLGVQKERERMLNDAVNQANVQYNQTLLGVRGQQQGSALQGAGLLNQSAMNSLGQFAPLINAGSGAIGAGTGALNAATNSQQAGAGILSDAAKNQIAQGTAMGNIGSQQTNAGQLLLQGQGQQQGALQNLLNSGLQANQIGTGALSNLSQNANQAGQLGVAQGNLGLQTQGQGNDQVLAMLQAIMQQANNTQRNTILKAGANAGAQISA